jgi:hypothetical protein
MRAVVAEKIGGQVSDWRHRGLIDDELAAHLAERYDISVSAGRVLLRWLGFFGVLMLGSSILGLVGMAMGDALEVIAPLLLGAFAVFLWRKGAQLAVDPQQRYPLTGSILLTVGLLGAMMACLWFLANISSGRLNDSWSFIALMFAGGAVYTAYRFGLRWPLVLGLLIVFHAIGNGSWTSGHGSYFFWIRDEQLTAVIALATLALGLWHEIKVEVDLANRHVGFGQVYVVFGLLYANLCFWFLSLPHNSLSWVLVFTAFGIAQIVAGARLNDGRLVGFGIVFLSINLYTRLFERFWDELSRGNFFLICGVIAMLLGAAFEFRARGNRPGDSQ